MARRGKKKGRPVSGWVVLDKPYGMGSTDAVAKVKWLFKAEKAGHAGTLDPLASGMLPIALGEATKTVPYVQDGAKVYRFTIAWGEERTTDDLEGVVARTCADRPDEAAIRALLPKYTGVIMQVPPQFSAIRIAGDRAYDLAREGEAVDIPAREIEIARFDLIALHDADHAEFEIECGKGTYVRSLARDMGRDLGCFGHVSALRRVGVEPFGIDALVTLEALEGAAPRPADAEGEEAPTDAPAGAATDAPADERPDPKKTEAKQRFAALDALLKDTGTALAFLPKVALSDEAANKVRLGNNVIVRGRDAPVEAEEACATQRGRLVAIGSVEAGLFKPHRVFRG